MKTILYIMTLVLCGTSFAQDPQLFEDTWYLQRLTIGGEEVFPPNIETVLEETIFDKSIPGFSSGYCFNTNYEVSFNDTNSSFDIINSVQFDGDGCNQTPSIIFGATYDDYFNDMVIFLNPFLYEITHQSGIRFLNFTNSNGDNALYANQLLALKEKELITISLYPNPVKKELSIKTAAIIERLEIYSIAGQLVKRASNFGDTSILNVENLIAGVYFVKLTAQEGLVSTRKIIKE